MKQTSEPSPTAKNWVKWIKVILKIVVLICTAIGGDLADIVSLLDLIP